MQTFNATSHSLIEPIVDILVVIKNIVIVEAVIVFEVIVVVSIRIEIVRVEVVGVVAVPRIVFIIEPDLLLKRIGFE